MLPVATPIEIGWVAEASEGEDHLIHPQEDWADWSEESKGIYGLARQAPLTQGKPAADVANRLLAAAQLLMAEATQAAGYDKPHHRVLADARTLWMVWRHLSR